MIVKHLLAVHSSPKLPSTISTATTTGLGHCNFGIYALLRGVFPSCIALNKVHNILQNSFLNEVLRTLFSNKKLVTDPAPQVD